jgi:hypothetical protein
MVLGQQFSEVSKTTKPSTPENKHTISERFSTLKTKIECIFVRGGSAKQKPQEIFKQLASQEIMGDQASSQEQKETPLEADDDTISMYDLNAGEKIKSYKEAQILSQKIKNEAQKDIENQPITDTLFPDRPSLYDQYHQQYDRERKTIKGAINRLTNIRRLQKEGLTKPDAREVYDSLRSRGITDYQIRLPQEDFFGKPYKDDFSSKLKLLSLFENAPKIIDRLYSLGLMDLSNEFDTSSLRDDILTLTDAQFLEKKEQISRLFFINKLAIREIMSQDPVSSTTLNFIDYFSTEFLIQQNQRIDFSIFQAEFIDLLKNTKYPSVYPPHMYISDITQKLIISDVNQDSAIKIHESLVPKEIKINSSSMDRVFLALSKMPGRAEQKCLINIYEQISGGKKLSVFHGGNYSFVNKDGEITIKFIESFVASQEKTSSGIEIKSSLFESVALSDSADYERLKSLLSKPETFSSFSSEDQKFWTKILSIGYTPYLKFLVRNKNTLDSLVDQNNKPTIELLFKIIEEKSEFSIIRSVCTPELAEQIPDSHSDKIFFTLISKINSETTYDFLTKNKDSIQQRIKDSSDPQELLTQYLTIIEQINSSPSKEILKIEDQLLIEIFNTPNPLETYQKISDIFIKNNLPMVGKIYRVFEALYPPTKVEEVLSNPKLSRVLINSHSSRLRQSIIFNDLLKINLGSSELSLVNYLNFLNQSAPVLEKSRLGSPLSPTETLQLSSFFRKLDTLYDSSMLSRLQSQKPLDTSSLQAKVSELYKKYSVKEGQTISDRVAEMYFFGLGIKTIPEALSYIKQSKESAHIRNLNQTRFSLSPGDLIKGVNPKNLGNILNFGCVAGEYLGSDAGSDATPFDTDTMKADQEYAISDYRNIAAKDYGDLFIVIKDRGQLQDTTDAISPKYDRSKLEIFKSGVVGQQHYGVRTGFPSSEIDFLITNSTDPKILENTFYEIAKHGVYIPVLNGEGQRIFSPTDYQRYRHSFDGVKQFSGDLLEIQRSQVSDSFYQEIINLKQSLQSEPVDSVSLADSQIRERIKSIFDSLGIPFKDQFDTSILGSRLYNIGSSGRHTNLPGDFDFDYNIVLDTPNYSKLKDIISEVKKQFPHQSEIPSADSSQIRITGVNGIGSESIDLDIGLNTTASTLIFASHEAIEQKLESIKQYYGEDAYREVVANILLTKKILKENHAYKKGDQLDGGFGGIGTENWILSNNGSIKKAFDTFWQAAHDNGRELTLDEFRKKYFILDSGENLRDTDRNHDNFIFALQDKGYKAMLKAISKYIS